MLYSEYIQKYIDALLQYITTDALINIIMEYLSPVQTFYAGKQTNVDYHFFNGPFELYFLTTKTMSVCASMFQRDYYNQKMSCVFSYMINKEVTNLFKHDAYLADRIRKLNPIPNCTFNKLWCFDFLPGDNLLCKWIDEPYLFLMSEKNIGIILDDSNKESYNLKIKTFNTTTIDIKLCKKERDQFILDFISISMEVFDIIRKYGADPKYTRF